MTKARTRDNLSTRRELKIKKNIQNTPERSRFLELWSAIGVSAATLAEALGYKSRNVPYYWRSGIYPPPQSAIDAMAALARSPGRVAELREKDAERKQQRSEKCRKHATEQAAAMTPEQRTERARKGGNRSIELRNAGAYPTRSGMVPGGRHEACRDCFEEIQLKECLALEEIGRAAKLTFNTFYLGTFYDEQKKCWAWTSKRTGKTYWFVADDHKAEGAGDSKSKK